MRERTEDHVGLVERRVLGRDERDIAPTYARALSALSVGGCEAQLETRVSGNEHAKLASCIATGAQDADREFMHRECITLQNYRVNLFAAAFPSGFCLLLRLSRETFQSSHHPVSRQA